MRTIRDYFKRIGREPTDIELETLAQTWSEHCVHKTLKSKVEFVGTIPNSGIRGQGSGIGKKGPTPDPRTPDPCGSGLSTTTSSSTPSPLRPKN